MYCDLWTIHNIGRGAREEVLACWTSKALLCILIVQNIKASFCKSGIYLIDPSILDENIYPSTTYTEVVDNKQGSSIPFKETLSSAMVIVSIEEVLQELLKDPCYIDKQLYHVEPCRLALEKPKIDYTKLIILTSDGNVAQME